ncbi:MAG: DedA family protein [bacterium]
MSPLDLFFHLDVYLKLAVQEYSTLVYFLLFGVVFLETGLVITPFLPGDSLLFAAGALAAVGSFNIWLLFSILFVAAVIGDTVNYHLGKFFGPQVFRKEKSFFFNQKYLLKAQAFYEKHGGKTIILARFIPIIRTFAPFVAGIGVMSYAKFLSYNVIGAGLWCILFVFGGYLFGNIPWVQANFNLIILLIIISSVLPLVKEVFSYLFRRKDNKALPE